MQSEGAEKVERFLRDNAHIVEVPLDNACKLFVLGNEDQLRLLNRLFGLQTRDGSGPSEA